MSHATSRGHGDRPAPGGSEGKSFTGRIVVAWAVVGIPLAYGVSQTLLRAADLFTG